MKNMIVYLALFIINVIFCPNNYWTLGYCILSLVLFGGYFISYKHYSKNKERVKESFLDGDLLIILVMMLSINIIVKIESANLLFGYTLSLIFLIGLVKNILKKSTWEEQIIKPTQLFDYYSLVYMASLLFMVFSHEI